MNNIKAEIVAHSISPQGEELISVLCTFPRIILAEVNTHRMLSKNTSSSRAIPFKKMVEMVETNPFIPIAWQKEHSGMQGTEYFTDEHTINLLNKCWKESSEEAIIRATDFTQAKVTKQLANRLLEPFSWTTMLITGPRHYGGWDNFFKLRNPAYDLGDGLIHKSKKDALLHISNNNLDKFDGMFITDMDWRLANKGYAEIHIMDLAEKIWDAVNESEPDKLEPGQFHIPYLSKIDSSKLKSLTGFDITKEMIKVSVAMAARTSYTVVGEEKALDYEALIGLHDRLLAQDPPHSSPLEHVAQCMTSNEHESFIKGNLNFEDSTYDIIEEPLFKEKGWCNNFKGFIPYRYIVDNKLSL